MALEIIYDRIVAKERRFKRRLRPLATSIGRCPNNERLLRDLSRQRFHL